MAHRHALHLRIGDHQRISTDVRYPRSKDRVCLRAREPQSIANVSRLVDLKSLYNPAGAVLHPDAQKLRAARRIHHRCAAALKRSIGGNLRRRPQRSRHSGPGTAAGIAAVSRR